MTPKGPYAALGATVGVGHFAQKYGKATPETKQFVGDTVGAIKKLPKIGAKHLMKFTRAQ